MPAFPGSDLLPDLAVLWAAVEDSYNEFGRQVVETDPVEIECWAKQFGYDESEGQNDSTSSEPKSTTDWVVDRFIAPNSQVWFGSLEDWEAQTGTAPLGPIWVVKSCTAARDDMAHGDDEVIVWNAHLEKFRNLL